MFRFLNARLLGPACLLLLLTAIALAAVLFDQRRAAERSVKHTLEVEKAISQARILMLRAEVHKRGYIVGAPDRSRQAAFDLQAQVRPLLPRLQRMTIDNPSQQQRLRVLRTLFEERARQTRIILDLAQRGERAQAVARLIEPTNEQRLARWAETIGAVEAEEQRLFDLRERSAKDLKLPFEIAIFSCIGLILLFATFFVVDRRRKLLRLEELNERLEQDIARRTELEAELIAARASAEAAASAKSSFLANMSHEIRTPMNGVLGFADLLLEADLPLDQHRHVQLIADSGRAMMRLLNDILDLSKIEAGQMQVVPEPVELRHALRNCFKLIRPAAEQKQLELCFDIAPELPAFVQLDGLRLRQIVLNLLGNAVKFTERGSVRFRARPDPADPAMLDILVQDTGVGIARERLPAIFEEFVQAEQSTARRFGGTGLGLAISRQLAELMGGSLAVDSAPGNGTSFTLRLPLVAAAAPDRVVRASGAKLAPARPLHLLLAEDHDVNQELMKAMLGQLGHRVTIANDGSEALAAVLRARAAGTPFDLVLMDMQMPVMDGVQSARAIRTAGETLPILALTANAYADDVAACLAAGMQAHLAKPVQLADLASAIARWTPDGPSAAPPVRAAPKIDPALRARYGERKAELRDHAARIRDAGSYTDRDIEELRGLLHKLAGSAGMFGEARLGSDAAEIEDALEAATPELRPDIVSKVLALPLAA